MDDASRLLIRAGTRSTLAGFALAIPTDGAQRRHAAKPPEAWQGPEQERPNRGRPACLGPHPWKSECQPSPS